MAKPKKVRFTGIVPMVNGHVISRAQSLSISPDLNFTEQYELGNPNIVEYDRDTPEVSITLNTNDFASIFNLRKVTNILTGNIEMSGLEGKTVGLAVQIEEDSVLKRTIVCANCYLSSINWSYDVDGIATENFSLTTDNKSVYTTTYKQCVVLPVDYVAATSTVATGTIASGAGLLATGSSQKYTYSLGSTPFTLDEYKLLYVWNDTFKSDISNAAPTDGGSEKTQITWSGDNTLDSGSRIFAIMYLDSPQANVDSYSTESGIATVRKGQVTIEIAPAGTGGTYGTWSRVQSCSIDVDLGRDELGELGNHYAYERSLPDPIMATVNITMLESDLEAFYDAAGLTTWDESTSTEIDIEDFSRSAAIRIKVYTNKDRLASQLRKTIILDQIQVTSESFDIDVNDNAKQTMTATTSYLTVSGADLS